MPRIHTRVARKDYPEKGIKKGDTYYSWQLYKGPLMRSKEYPRRSELTGSSFLAQAYDLIDVNLASVTTIDDINSLAEEVRTLGDEAQASYENIPEQLQSSDTGTLLERRYEMCQEFLQVLEDVGSRDYEENKDENQTEEEWIQSLKDEISESEPEWE